MSFSQWFKDGATQGSEYNCDEWPTAGVKQVDFQVGTIRNSLRCINQRENSSGGAQLKAFVEGDNKEGLKKTCKGKVVDGDYWNIDFNLDDIKEEDVKNCKDPQCENLPKAQSTYTDQVGTKTKDKEKNIITVKGLAYETEVIFQGEDPFKLRYFKNTNPLEYFAWNTKSKGTDKNWEEDGYHCKTTKKDQGDQGDQGDKGDKNVKGDKGDQNDKKNKNDKRGKKDKNDKKRKNNEDDKNGQKNKKAKDDKKDEKDYKYECYFPCSW
ncbi:MAG: hypothetical protein Q9182_002149 [Xanthomendoza sp. 2 TL-2023]